MRTFAGRVKILLVTKDGDKITMAKEEMKRQARLSTEIDRKVKGLEA